MHSKPKKKKKKKIGGEIVGRLREEKQQPKKIRLAHMAYDVKTAT
jgi:hypothetical protein